MAKYVIEDTTLIGIADAIRAKTGGTDPIAVTDMAAQIAAITGGGSEELITIFPETELSFAFNETMGAYAHYENGVTFFPAVGDTYVVKWDGVSYTCTVQDASAVEAGAVALGDMSSMGGTGNGEPFVMGWFGTTLSLFAFDAQPTHTVGLFQEPSSGGGSVEGIVYITYMNGTTELGKTACMKGDSTVDPVEDGKFAVPTKEPTVDTVYTYAGGWALTDGGEADEMALIDVTEDRVVYAAYTEGTRYYTVRFFDGETLLDSQQLTYGATPSYTAPKKAGHKFIGWSTEVVAVTADVDYYAQWNEVTVEFASATWEEIAAVSEGGLASQYFSVGESRTMEFNGETIEVEILGFDHDALADGSGYAGISLMCKTAPSSVSGATLGLTDEYSINTAGDTALFPLFPADLQAVVKNVKKMCCIGSSKFQFSTGELGAKVWFPSTSELNVPCTLVYSKATEDTLPDLGETYELYASSMCSGGKYGMYTYVPLRSLIDTNSNNPTQTVFSCYMYREGSKHYNYNPYTAIAGGGVKLGFCFCI